MEYKDYMLTLRGKRMLFDMQEGWLRRSTYIISEVFNLTMGGKGVSKAIDSWWPYGSEKTLEDISVAIQRKKEKGKIIAANLMRVKNIGELIKQQQRKKRARRATNTGRG